MHPVQSIGYAAAYPAYPLNPPLAGNYRENELNELTDVENTHSSVFQYFLVGIRYFTVFV